MYKRLTKPHEKNERLERPSGLLGVPPDFSQQTYILVTNDMSVKEVIDRIMPGTKRYYTQ